MYMKRDQFLFRRPDPRSATRGYNLSQYMGLPPAAQWDGGWMVQTWDMARTLDQEAIVDNPAAINETLNGREWVQTQLTGSTLSIVDTGFPPYLRIATPGTATSGQSMQAIRGAVGSTQLLYDTSAATDIYMSITMRISDANNDNDTTNECRFFIGFAPVDTSILTAVDDYIGFHKADGTGLVRLVADQTSGDPASASTSVDGINITTAGLQNQWFTLHLHAVGLDRTAQSGRVFGFLDYHRRPAGSVDRSPTLIGELDLTTNSDVPGANMAPSIAFIEGEAVAKNLDITKIVAAAKYDLGAAD